jgi:hypothetical protein
MRSRVPFIGYNVPPARGGAVVPGPLVAPIGVGEPGMGCCILEGSVLLKAWGSGLDVAAIAC